MSFDLNDLCQQGGVTPRTVRYYVQQGLLPSPGLGTGARYGAGHLARLRVIRKLQAQHLPLAEIRRRLEGLDDQAVERLLEASPGAEGEATSAVDYVRRVLGRSAGHAAQTALPSAPPSSAPRFASGSASSASGPARPVPSVPDRAQWERIALTADVEVHVRRPLSREDNRRLEKLLENARELFRG